jgi:hypothetical protein
VLTERKPPGLSFESWVDKLIRDGIERGEFDDLPGKGKPLPDLDRPRDELWWVRDKLKREDVQFLPPTLQIRKDLDEVREKIANATDETVVRRLIAEINEQIRYVNSHVTHGPPSTLMPLDIERTVTRWRESRPDESKQG